MGTAYRLQSQKVEVQCKSEKLNANSRKMGTSLKLYSLKAGPYIYPWNLHVIFFLVCTKFNADNKVLQIEGFSAPTLEEGTADCGILDKQKMLSLLEGSSTASTLMQRLLFWSSYLINLLTSYFVCTEKYEPVSAKWTTERCAVCRWVEDWEENKMIICNRLFYGQIGFTEFYSDCII